MARPSKAKAIERLQKVLNEIPALVKLERGSNEFKKWHRDTRVAIENTFVNEPSKIKDFSKIRYSPIAATTSTSGHEFQRAYVSGLGTADAMLKSMIGEIQEYWEDENYASMTPISQDDDSRNTNEIFIIHGRDNEAKVTIARFLERLDLKPIILHEQPNQGRTIIEKFKQHAQVGFAVALLTPDDIGALKEDARNLKSRARQNVIFEFGYFIGRIGRNRVCALTKGDVEIPSDYDGVVYIPLDDAGGWKMEFVRELKGAGIDVDANRAL